MELGGDWTWKKQILRLQQSAQHNDVCLQCVAAKTSGPLNNANCARDAPCFQPENRRKFEDYTAEQLASFDGLPAITVVLGYHSGTVVDDLLHDDLLGIRQHLCGAAMLDLAERGIWGNFAEIKRWKERLTARLSVASKEFEKFQREKRFQGVQNNSAGEAPQSLAATLQTLHYFRFESDIMAQAQGQGSQLRHREFVAL